MERRSKANSDSIYRHHRDSIDLFTFRFKRSPLAPLDPLAQLAFPQPPLTTDFERRQITAADHPLQRPRRDMQQRRRFGQSEQSNLIKIPIH